jgi:hypothetical protein
MEETNYDRAPLEAIINSASVSGETSPKLSGSDPEKTMPATSADVDLPVPELGQVLSTKTFVQKLKLLDKPRPFNVPRMMTRPLIFLTFPVIAYAGFSYGSNLVWFNVLNGTASLVLSGPPYNFSVSLSFLLIQMSHY